jgi:hypothetical protein
MAEVEADAEQRRIVAKSMHRIPDNMNIKEGYNLLILLYKARILSDTWYDEDENWYDEDENTIDFGKYFDLDSETGMITSLNLCRYNSYINSDSDDDNDDNNRNIGIYLPFNVPPTIDQFQSLESIDIRNCRLIPKELGNLPLLKTIELHACPRSLFENIPDGLQLASVKQVAIGTNWSEFDPSLSPILKIFSNSLEELCFHNTTRKRSIEILQALQDDDLSFRQSITTIHMRNCKLNEDDLVILMFNIRERFINLREIDVSNNDIKSLCGIENKIKQVLTSSFLMGSVISIGSNLRKLDLNHNPILKTVSNGSEDNSTQISALLTILNNFDGISNLGSILKVNEYEYDPDVENVLRINHAGRKLIRNKEIPSGIIATATDTTAHVINPALWPLILERAYKKSYKIYDREDEQCRKSKCATGIFDLVLHYWPRLLKQRYKQQ